MPCSTTLWGTWPKGENVFFYPFEIIVIFEGEKFPGPPAVSYKRREGGTHSLTPHTRENCFPRMLGFKSLLDGEAFFSCCEDFPSASIPVRKVFRSFKTYTKKIVAAQCAVYCTNGINVAIFRKIENCTRLHTIVVCNVAPPVHFIAKNLEVCITNATVWKPFFPNTFFRKKSSEKELWWLITK